MHKGVMCWESNFLGCAALLLAQPHHPVIFVFVFVFFCSFSTFCSLFIVVSVVDVAATIVDALQLQRRLTKVAE